MSAFPNGFNANLDRYDIRSAARLFHALWPEPQVQRSCAAGLADSVRTAHEAGSGCWSVTMFEDYIRLNIGQVEVLSLFEHATRILFRAPLDALPAAEFTIRLTDTPIYPAVPVPSGLCLTSPVRLASLPAPLREAHYAFIVTAASYKRVSPFKRSFSPAVLEFIESVLSVSLPRPSYTDSARPERVLPLADELDESQPIREGARHQITVNAYERDPRARTLCVAHHGCTCAICGFSFEKFYGAVAKGFIHVHHLRPLSEFGEEHEVDPVADLRPVCPNCHAVLHLRVPAYSIEDVLNFRRATQPVEPAG